MGRSRGGLTTKIHVVVDANGLPITLKLTEGQAHDGRSAEDMLDTVGPRQTLLADRAYDSDALRQRLAERQAEAVIPTTTSRKQPIPYDTIAYRQRNTVERLWARLKDYRRVATRYDKLADNFLAGVLIAAIVSYWAK